LGAYGWPTKVNSVEIEALLIEEVIMYKIIQTFHGLSLLGLTEKPLDVMRPRFAAREISALRPREPRVKNLKFKHKQTFSHSFGISIGGLLIQCSHRRLDSLSSH